MAECYIEQRRFQLGLMDDAAECFVSAALSPSGEGMGIGGGRRGGGVGGVYGHVKLGLCGECKEFKC